LLSGEGEETKEKKKETWGKESSFSVGSGKGKTARDYKLASPGKAETWKKEGPGQEGKNGESLAR